MIGSRAQCYKTYCRVKLLYKMGFFTQKSKSSKFHGYIKFYSENESKIKIIPCTDFFYSINCRLKLF